MRTSTRRTRTYFEQIPVQKVKAMIAGMTDTQAGGRIAPNTPLILHCRICHKPVPVETAKTDWEGQAIHEECYVISVSRKSAVSRTKRTHLLS
jgi:hypothetical protein